MRRLIKNIIMPGISEDFCISDSQLELIWIEGTTLQYIHKDTPELIDTAC